MSSKNLSQSMLEAKKLVSEAVEIYNNQHKGRIMAIEHIRKNPLAVSLFLKKLRRRDVEGETYLRVWLGDKKGAVKIADKNMLIRPTLAQTVYLKYGLFDKLKKLGLQLAEFGEKQKAKEIAQKLVEVGREEQAQKIFRKLDDIK